MRGPIDFIIVGFPGSNFNGGILKELEKPVKDGIIKVLDVSLVTKDDAGALNEISLLDSDIPEVQAAAVTFGDLIDLIDQADVEEVGELLENGDSAGLLIVEHLWAKGLKQAILKSDGVLLSEGRIHPDASKELEGGE